MLEPVWPGLVKFRHLDKLSNFFGKLLRVYFVFGKIFNIFWQLKKFGQIWVVVSSQIMKNNLAIWSHWLERWIRLLLPNLQSCVRIPRTQSTLFQLINLKLKLCYWKWERNENMQKEAGIGPSVMTNTDLKSMIVFLPWLRVEGECQIWQANAITTELPISFQNRKSNV